MTEQMVLNESEIESLLEIADGNQKERSFSEPQAGHVTASPISCLLESSLFRGYGLDEKDVKIIATLLGCLLDGKDGIKTADVIKTIEKNRRNLLSGLNRVTRLRELGIIEAAAGRGCEDGNGMGLLRSSLALSGEFLGRMNPPNVVLPANITEPYRDNLEYLADQFERVGILRDRIPSFVKRSSVAIERKEREKKVKEVEGRIEERLRVTKIALPFEELKKKEMLDRAEGLIIISLLESYMNDGEPCDIESLTNLISSTPYERLLNRRYFEEKDNRLFKNGIIEFRKHLFRGGATDIIKLTGKIRAGLLGEKRAKKGAIKQKGKGFFEEVKPSVPLEQVILHPKTADEIGIAMKMVEGGASDLLKEWGLEKNLQGGGKGHRPLLMLFHGAPGTGKTLSANAIAHALKRTLLTFDCSKILGMYVGESEKNTRRIFDQYREMAKGKKRPPVLLLNEADQFLHRRLNATRSVDHMYNQMQNIFLEQMESFEGVLIATTNLAENLDPAFSRRFHFKIEFRRPEGKERFKLWQVHIPEKLPLEKDVDFQTLAENYDLSGGQIAVVVRTAAARAAQRGGRLCMSDLREACESEIGGNFDEKARGRVGF